MKNKKIFTIMLLLLQFTLLINFTNAQELSSQLKGKILLQVEDKGQAWYVTPDTGDRAFLGRPDDAFQIMRELGLGISNNDLNRITTKDEAHKDLNFAKKLAGKILLQVEENGEAWYIYPSDNKRYYLGRPDDAFRIMRELGLGISNDNLEKISVNEKYKEKNYSQSGQTLYKVTRVVDGDTIKVEINGNEETIRLIGINTPETVHPTKEVECFGLEASNKAKETLDGKMVILEIDSNKGNTDHYNRLLRYVFLEDGTNFNKLMIAEGFAYEDDYNVNYKYQDEFETAENNAKTQKLGLWGDGVCVDNTSSNDPESEEQTGDCECSSDTYNCSSFKTQKEAQAIYDCCGGVSNDIHRLDMDNNGVACESLP